MYKIQTLNKIAKIGTDVFPAGAFAVGTDVADPDGILVRSMNMHESPLPDGLKAIARAGAGTNNIPIESCSARGIVVFNTPGANANAVKELVLAGMLMSSRKIADGVVWARTLRGQADAAAQIEKGKAQFVGPELYGKKMGVIGLGAIGVLVANAAASSSVGMEVYGFDPYMSVDAAWALSRSVRKAKSIEEIFSACDYVSIHVPLSSATRGMFNGDVFQNITAPIRLMNFARAELVDNAALAAALADGRIAAYVTDFPTADVLEMDNVLPIPHLGASTPESEDNCAIMASRQMKEYLEYGSIRNSVNFPDCALEPTDKTRITVLHKAQPNIVSPLTNAFINRGVNIHSVVNKSGGELAYTVMDIACDASQAAVDEISALEGVLAMRVINNG